MEKLKKIVFGEDQENIQAEEFAHRLRELLTHDCERGKKEGCHELASFFQVAERNFPEAEKIYKKNCLERDYAPSCFALGYLYLTSKEKNYNKALSFFIRGCDGNSSGACNNAGLIYQSGHEKSNIERDMNKAISFFTRGCIYNHKNACLNLSCIYLSGKNGIAKDMVKALELSIKACELGHPWGCANASRIYKIGDGIEKNLEKAEKYKNLAKDLQNS